MSGFPLTSTYSSLADEVIHNLQGFGQSSNAMATLESDVTTGDVTVSLDDATSFGRGVIEIDD